MNVPSWMVVGIVALGLGFGVGRFTAPASPAPAAGVADMGDSALPPPSDSPAPPRAPAEPARPPASAPAPSRSARPAPSPSQAPLMAVRAKSTEQIERELARVRQELETTRQALQQARSDLTVATEMAVESEGERIVFPESLGAEYRGPSVHRRIDEAIADLGFDAEVQSLDCTEYPCIVYGRLGSPDGTEAGWKDVQHMHRRVAETYEEPEFYVSHTAQEAEDGSAELLFSLSYYPKGATELEKAAMGRRMRFRKNQYFDAR